MTNEDFQKLASKLKESLRPINVKAVNVDKADILALIAKVESLAAPSIASSAPADELAAFEKAASILGYSLPNKDEVFSGMYHCSERTERAWKLWQTRAAIAAQQAAPAARLTDEQIDAIATEYCPDAIVTAGLLRKLCRAIEAAAAPNAALVEALAEMVKWFGRYPEWLPAPETFEKYKASIEKARAALASLPVPPKEADRG